MSKKKVTMQADETEVHHQSQYQVDPATFVFLAYSIISQQRANGIVTQHRRFQSFFGTSPLVCSILWQFCRVSPVLTTRARPIHLLWALMFLKTWIAIRGRRIHPGWRHRVGPWAIPLWRMA